MFSVRSEGFFLSCGLCKERTPDDDDKELSRNTQSKLRMKVIHAAETFKLVFQDLEVFEDSENNAPGV
jgi:hypothetical protein